MRMSSPGQTQSVEEGGWIRNSKLAIACFAIFAILMVAQSLTGWRDRNNDAHDHHQPAISYPHYLTTGHFVEATFENWESEFLQMGAYIALTMFLVQKGSAESKDPVHEEDDPESHAGDPDAPWPVRRGGVWLTLYKNSLLAAFVFLFIGSWIGHALGGTAEYNANGAAHGQSPVSVLGYIRTSSFWFQSFQNWQSEFLAVGAIVVLSIFLRQYRSPESKPVIAPNAETGS